MRERETFSVERKAANGNYIAFACGPLKRPRYINERIEQELIEFKVEIEERFEKSDVNNKYKFPRAVEEDDYRRKAGLLSKHEKLMAYQGLTIENDDDDKPSKMQYSLGNPSLRQSDINEQAQKQPKYLLSE